MPEPLRVYRLRRDLVRVSGPDAVAYLQGQVSQDVAGLEVGASAWSWILQPAGKVDALVRLTRTGPDTLEVDVDEGWGQAVVTRLTRFKLRTKVDIEPAPPGASPPHGDSGGSGGMDVLALRGPGAGQAAAGLGRGDPLAARAPLWPATEEAADAALDGRQTVSFPPGMLGEEEWEAERVVAGVPAMGAELTERTIPAETGLVDRTVSFTKGCYTGQELVARIDSRGGHVPRHLRGLRSASLLEVGAELVAGGKVVGTVTSAARSASLGPVGLAYVTRAVTPRTVVDAAGLDVEVVELP